MNKSGIWLFTLLTTAALAQSGSVPVYGGLTGVTGVIRDESGKEVSGARVSIALAAPTGRVSTTPPLTTGPQVTTTNTDANGRYFASVPPGSYVVCVYDPTPKLLNPCTWSTQAPAFQASPGQSIVTRDIVLYNGAVLSVQVEDPQKLLKEKKSDIENDCRVQVVTSSGHKEDAVIRVAGSGREYRIAVPKGVPLDVTVYSPSLAIVDEAGKSAAGASKKIQVSTEMDTPAFRYTVTGVRP